MSSTIRTLIPTLAAGIALSILAGPAAADPHAFGGGRYGGDHVQDRRTDHHDHHDRRGDRREEARLRAELDELRAELDAYRDAYGELDRALQRIDTINRRNHDRRTRRPIARTVAQARRRAGGLLGMFRDRAPVRPVIVHVEPPPPPPPPAPIIYQPMEARAFAVLLQQVDRAGFADDQLGLIRAAARVHHFSVAQVIELMKTNGFDDNRIEIAVACAPNVIDPDRWFEVYGALSFTQSRATLRQRLGL